MERKTVNDIIERLRQYKGPWLVPAEAADEIEKLRDQIKTVSAMNIKLVEAHESVVAERDAALKALTGWRDHYGWKDGEYIDNVNNIFKPIIDAARGEK